MMPDSKSPLSRLSLIAKRYHKGTEGASQHAPEIARDNPVYHVLSRTDLSSEPKNTVTAPQACSPLAGILDYSLVAIQKLLIESSDFVISAESTC